MIPHNRLRLGAEYSNAVARVLASGQVAYGPEAAALEAEVCRCLGRSHAVAVDSGTAALMLALRSLMRSRAVRKVGIPAYSCRAIWHAVCAAGCAPVCMDCRADLRLDPRQARAMAGQLDAVILVHPFGLIEPMAAEDWPCPLIEDIATAAGGSLNGRPLGAFGDLAVVSFYATKPWGGAGGGMVIADDAGLIAVVAAMAHADTAAPGLAYAGNHRLSDVHAALARVRLAAAASEAERRRRLASLYDGWLAGKHSRPVPRDKQGNHYRYLVRTPMGAEAAIARLRAAGVEACRPVPQTLDTFAAGSACPEARAAWRECLSLPLYADLADDEVKVISQAVRRCLD